MQSLQSNYIFYNSFSGLKQQQICTIEEIVIITSYYSPYLIESREDPQLPHPGTWGLSPAVSNVTSDRKQSQLLSIIEFELHDIPSPSLNCLPINHGLW